MWFAGQFFFFFFSVNIYIFWVVLMMVQARAHRTHTHHNIIYVRVWIRGVAICGWISNEFIFVSILFLIPHTQPYIQIQQRVSVWIFMFPHCHCMSRKTIPHLYTTTTTTTPHMIQKYYPFSVHIQKCIYLWLVVVGVCMYSYSRYRQIGWSKKIKKKRFIFIKIGIY